LNPTSRSRNQTMTSTPKNPRFRRGLPVGRRRPSDRLESSVHSSARSLPSFRLCRACLRVGDQAQVRNQRLSAGNQHTPGRQRVRQAIASSSGDRSRLGEKVAAARCSTAAYACAVNEQVLTRGRSPGPHPASCQDHRCGSSQGAAVFQRRLPLGYSRFHDGHPSPWQNREWMQLSSSELAETARPSPGKAPG
jgi:hypothetical protein